MKETSGVQVDLGRPQVRVPQQGSDQVPAAFINTLFLHRSLSSDHWSHNLDLSGRISGWSQINVLCHIKKSSMFSFDFILNFYSHICS